MGVRAGCSSCEALRTELAAARAENDEQKKQLRELNKLCISLEGEVERFRLACQKLQPNRPEHASKEQLQLVLAEVLASFPANDAGAVADDAAADPAPPPADDGATTAPPAAGPPKPKKKPRGGRRNAEDLAHLPVEEIVVDPPEVVACGGEGYIRIGQETSDHVAFRSASHILLRHVRTTWKKVDGSATPTIVTAPLPQSVWPRTMADPSTIVQIILSKYDMSLPLHRQERASPRQGFYLPRSTQCGWLGEAYEYLYRVVDAMMVEACATAHCIATDATSAPVRQHGECARWHVFVFLADRDHVIFRAVRDHTSASIADLLDGFEGNLLSDASSVYDMLHRELNMLGIYCWAHVRRYFWKCRDTDPAMAAEALAILGQLFGVERETKDIAMPERTSLRARRALPILGLWDAWIARARGTARARTPLAAAITYYDNQREGLRRFLADGRLRIDNNLCEQQLRALVLGRRNWTFFENPNGLRWWTVFRSLIASCALHGLEPQEYLEEILRLAPHWPTTRMLELSPRYWARTRAALSTLEREIIRRPWEKSTEVATSVVDRPAA